jgi:hypothetical protein
MIDFTYISSDDTYLASSITRPPGDGHAENGATAPRPTVIMVHGLTGNRLGRGYHLVEFARRLARAGIACIRFDQSGCGESTGEFEQLTIPRMASDVTAVHQWAMKQSWCDAKRIGFVGLSLGALPVIDSDAQRPARAIALWAPVFNMPRVFRETARTELRALLEHQGWVPYRGLRIGKAFIDQLDAIDPAKLLGSSSGPLRLYHSDADDVVSIDESRAYVEHCQRIGRPCALERFTNADHDFVAYDDRQRLLASTVDFFVEHLNGGRMTASDDGERAIVDSH